MTAWAVELDNAGVAYRQYGSPLVALWEGLWPRPRHALFHVLQGVSLRLPAGAALGVVGDNGAGKSTLLRMLAGYLPPTSGTCVVRGRRAALLELGAAFQPEASGWENARLSLALQGLDHASIRRYLPQVLAFAELTHCADQPVQTYSSGMVVRLAFALATVGTPDVLIVDEALSVGDQHFQKKSLDRMRALLAQGATLVFCSHNLYQVREMCQQAVWLEQGRVRMLGEAQTVVDAYQDAVRQRAAMPDMSSAPAVQPSVQGAAQLLAVTLNADAFRTHDPFAVEVRAHAGAHPVEDVHVGIVIRRNDGVQCYGISTLHDGVRMQAQADRTLAVRWVIPALPLLAGEYCLEVWLIDGSGVHVYDARERCCPFRVQQASQAQGIGMAWLAHRWEGVAGDTLAAC